MEMLQQSLEFAQYAGEDFRDVLKDYAITASMSRRGNCWDTQSTIHFERWTDLTHAGIGRAALALTRILMCTSRL